MTTLRPLGVGSQILTHGDKMAGFYGEVNGIITADELRSKVGVAQGTPMQTGDITWLKFSHNYKTLYIAKQPIQHSISWDYLQERDLVFGKMIEIDGNVYLLRLIQGYHINPVGNVGGTITGGGNDEWSSLMNRLVFDWAIYSNNQLMTDVRPWCQEIHNNLTTRLGRGSIGDIRGSAIARSNLAVNSFGWQPVLELLY